MGYDIIVEPDDRGRISLAKIPGVNAERYVGRRLPDGSIILQPAVVLTSTALESLLELQASPRPVPRSGRPLSEALRSRNVRRATDAELAVARQGVAERRARGARSVSDLTPEELSRLRGGTAVVD
jgi:hypothetical protein